RSCRQALPRPCSCSATGSRKLDASGSVKIASPHRDGGLGSVPYTKPRRAPVCRMPQAARAREFLTLPESATYEDGFRQGLERVKAANHPWTELCKQVAKRTGPLRTSTHSKRRISTGSSRAAARAGTTVARRDIPIATTEIHTPSASFA